MFLVLCVLIGRLPDPGVSTPAPLSVAAVGVSFPKIQNEPRGYESVCLCACMCVRERKGEEKLKLKSGVYRYACV